MTQTVGLEGNDTDSGTRGNDTDSGTRGNDTVGLEENDTVGLEVMTRTVGNDRQWD